MLITANCSSRVSRPFTTSLVECAVKIEVFKTKGAGKVEATVDSSSIDASELNTTKSGVETESTLLKVELEKILTNVFNDDSLVIIPGKLCWYKFKIILTGF